MRELREVVRRRVCLGGRIGPAREGVPAPDPSGTECRLRNLSPGGAMLQFAPGIALPERFDLTVACRNAVYRAALVWRRGDAAGVRFLDTIAAPENRLAALAAELRASRAEIVRLRERLAALDAGSRPPDTRLH